MPFIDFEAIEEAARREPGILVRTPLLESDALNRRVGRRLLVKAEGLQRTGSFKARGAWNRVSRLLHDERTRGVLAFSSGNHGRAVAWAAARLSVPAVVVMPADAPASKIANTRRAGAEVVLFDRRHDDREAIGRKIAGDRGLTMIPPYDDAHVIAGAGTAALEIVQQAAEAGSQVGTMAVGCGGGGLTAGCALVLERLVPMARLYAVEPAGYDDTARSLIAGYRVGNDSPPPTQCDSLMTAIPGELTFGINQGRLAGAVAVSDMEVEEAMRTLFSELGIVAEPGGAVAVAAAIAGRLPLTDGALVAVVSGANVDPSLFAQILSR